MSSTSALSRNVGKVSNAVSSLRVRPFLGSGKRQQVRVRVAEPEVAEDAPAGGAPEPEFEFSIADARKNNEYASSDVEAALRFYFEGGAAPSHNDDFISNEYGDEDASFFDDIDNNEAYDADEFSIAGIPEAAPKKRRGGRRGQGEDADEDDQIAKGKEIDRLKAMEDQMVMEAALEEEFGSGYDDQQDAAQVVANQQGVWDWLTDADASPEAGDELARSKLATVRRSKIELPSDKDVLSAFNTLKMDELDDQTRDMLDLIVGDEVTEDELKGLDFNVSTDDLPQSEGVSAEDAARMEAVAAQPFTELEPLGDGTLPVPMVRALGCFSERFVSRRGSHAAPLPAADARRPQAGQGHARRLPQDPDVGCRRRLGDDRGRGQGPVCRRRRGR